MADVVTINRPDVVALIEPAADQPMVGNKTDAVAMALRTLQNARGGSLFSAHTDCVRVVPDVDLVPPVLQDAINEEPARARSVTNGVPLNTLITTAIVWVCSSVTSNDAIVRFVDTHGSQYGFLID